MISMATIEDFKKLDLRVGKVLEAERVEGSDKLVKMQIYFGEEKRQILAGIGKAYAPEDLVGKELVAIINLETRMLMGFESQGMILAASDEVPVILIPQKDVPPGVSIR